MQAGEEMEAKKSKTLRNFKMNFFKDFEPWYYDQKEQLLKSTTIERSWIQEGRACQHHWYLFKASRLGPVPSLCQCRAGYVHQ